MSLFEIQEQPRSINGGAVRYDIRQLYPVSAAITNARPGVNGAATGITTFQWNDDVNYWIPAASYFTIRGHFLDGSGNALARPPLGPASTATPVAYVDNWPSVLFQQIQAFCNSSSLELLQNPPQADTALLYSSVDRTWLKSFASASGVGEGFQTRALNSAQFGTAAVGTTNYNEVVATWRPSISLFDCAEAIPPGAQWRVDFSWSNTAEQNMIESLASNVVVTDFTFTIDEFTFYKATVVPDPMLELPTRGIIELNPVQVNVYPLTGTNQLQVNVPLKNTTHRVLVACQDNNTANSLACGQNGLKPITSFGAAFSSGATDFTAYISNLYMSFPELGYQAPNPTYSLTAGSAAGSKSEWARAYADWITICKGSTGGYEGSVPFGAFDTGIGTAILRPLETVTPVMQVGDPNNDQQYWNVSTATAAVAATVGAQFARWGWLGRCPGPIFAFPVIRPPDKMITNANMQLTLSASATSVNVFVISSYSKILMIQKDEMGRNRFDLLDGL